jgi:hypothetical protein
LSVIERRTYQRNKNYAERMAEKKRDADSYLSDEEDVDRAISQASVLSNLLFI